jgi:hypothetical protein
MSPMVEKDKSESIGHVHASVYLGCQYIEHLHHCKTIGRHEYQRTIARRRQHTYWRVDEVRMLQYEPIMVSQNHHNPTMQCQNDQYWICLVFQVLQHIDP